MMFDFLWRLLIEMSSFLGGQKQELVNFIWKHENSHPQSNIFSNPTTSGPASFRMHIRLRSELSRVACMWGSKQSQRPSVASCIEGTIGLGATIHPPIRSSPHAITSERRAVAESPPTSPELKNRILGIPCAHEAYERACLRREDLGCEACVSPAAADAVGASDGVPC